MKKNATFRIDNKIIHEMDNYVALGHFRSRSQMMEEIMWLWLEAHYDEDLPARYPHKNVRRSSLGFDETNGRRT